MKAKPLSDMRLLCGNIGEKHNYRSEKYSCEKMQRSRRISNRRDRLKKQCGY
jgi:hypothetical protein